MKKFFILCFIFCLALANGQNKKPKQNNPNPEPVNSANQPMAWEGVDSTAYYDSIAAAKKLEPVIPRQFMVYTKKPKQKTERYKLCFNLVNKDTVLNYCVNDSLCKDPEVSKILFETKMGDSTYVLIFVDAFTKAGDDYPNCNSGKETKLVFVRWNTKTNKAKFKQKTVSSCLRNIVNMTKDPIVNWDGSTVLEVNYYKGGSDFPVIKFDPAQPLLGLQETSEAEPR